MSRAHTSERVVVAMSGGVDSSVAAALLQAQGYEVIGITMKLWDGAEATATHHKTCCTLDDVSDARRVAMQLGIPFYVVNFQEQFARHVIDYFVASYQQGYTPESLRAVQSVLEVYRPPAARPTARGTLGGDGALCLGLPQRGWPLLHPARRG